MGHRHASPPGPVRGFDAGIGRNILQNLPNSLRAVTIPPAALVQGNDQICSVLPGGHDCVIRFLLFWVESMRLGLIVLFVAGLYASLVPPNAAWGQSAPASSLAGSVASTPIGKVVTAAGSVTIEHADAVVVQVNIPATGSGQTKIGDPVYRGDVVQTGTDGKVGITFTDGTAFNLSSNARMVLNEFVYDPKGTSNSTLFSLSKGTFTFIAGKVAKTGDMKIDTPVATMGIRGTTPHVQISDDGTVSFPLLLKRTRPGASSSAGAWKRTSLWRPSTGARQNGDRPRTHLQTGRQKTISTGRSTSTSRFAGAVEPPPSLGVARPAHVVAFEGHHRWVRLMPRFAATRPGGGP